MLVEFMSFMSPRFCLYLPLFGEGQINNGPSFTVIESEIHSETFVNIEDGVEKEWYCTLVHSHHHIKLLDWVYIKGA